ncbi:hypothetical protein PV04_07670 [Phialophora macrospora]|uniref:Cupin type-2 domain-containing protein n=1 Tax=Phialophora macrospora TaxID=1851006 RepID=A0A0D2DTF1_9EURO|nr:hypothetical protein PV04_07670 [Phialophora macrospora]
MSPVAVPTAEYTTNDEPKRGADAKSTINSRLHLEASIEETRLAALWNVGANVTIPEPRTKHIPAVWRYADTKALLLKAGELVPAEESERRALIMVNPGPRKPPHTLDTILSAHQLLLPHERALCHRHTPFAVRFLIEGRHGYTAIAGKKMYMEPGDLIITPQWEWHDHGNDGDENVIWLDGLNIPFFNLNPIDFLELYEDHFGTITHPSTVVTDEECADMKFPWTKTKVELDASKADHAIHYYRLPNGKEVNSIVSATAERVSAGTETVPRQDTANRIYQVHSGSGRVVVAAPRSKETHELSWGPGDTFVIPSWHRWTIYADKDSSVYLFSFSDKAMLDNLGIYRKETRFDL